MSVLVVWFLFWVLVGGLVGWAIGNSKGRAGEGLALGLLLGIIGWLIIAVMEPSDEVRRERQAETMSLAAAFAGAAQGQAMGDHTSLSGGRPNLRACPWCAESIKAAARVCRFCNRDVEPLQGFDSATGGVDVADRPFDIVRTEFPGVYDEAFQCMKQLEFPPAHPAAWLRELCSRVAQGAPLDAAARNIPLDWFAPLPTLAPPPVMPSVAVLGSPGDAGEYERVKALHPTSYDVGRGFLAGLLQPPDCPEAWLEELCSRIDLGAPPKAAASRIPLNWPSRTQAFGQEPGL